MKRPINYRAKRVPIGVRFYRNSVKIAEVRWEDFDRWYCNGMVDNDRVKPRLGYLLDYGFKPYFESQAFKVLVIKWKLTT